MCKNILAIDIGNSHTKLGLFLDGHLAFTARSVTDRKRTSDDFAVTLSGVFAMNKTNIADLNGSVLSSVVSRASDAVICAVERLTGKRPLIAGPETAGIPIEVESPERVGTDRITNAVAAAVKYEKPLIVLDLGTATTVTVVSSEGAFIGGSIYPGVMTSLEALVGAAAQLPHTGIGDPGSVIAKNTVDCIYSGIVYGTASMLDGIIGRIEDELGAKATSIATGGLAHAIVRYCKKCIVYDANLLLEGLYHIYMLNAAVDNEDGDF